jgi:hypothetical protein
MYCADCMGRRDVTERRVVLVHVYFTTLLRHRRQTPLTPFILSNTTPTVYSPHGGATRGHSPTTSAPRLARPLNPGRGVGTA